MNRVALAGLIMLCGWMPDPSARITLDDSGVCVGTDPPVYYAIDLVSTKKLAGTRLAFGTVDMTFQSSPFGVAVGIEGHYRYDLRGRISKMKPPKRGEYVVWLATPDLKQVRLVGPLTEDMTFEGDVEWQKFLVIVTLEESFDPDQPRWQGPVALRGLSRSGRMHTMAGHGPFQSEPCAFYGYR